MIFLAPGLVEGNGARPAWAFHRFVSPPAIRSLPAPKSSLLRYQGPGLLSSTGCLYLQSPPYTHRGLDLAGPQPSPSWCDNHHGYVCRLFSLLSLQHFVSIPPVFSCPFQFCFVFVDFCLFCFLTVFVVGFRMFHVLYLAYRLIRISICFSDCIIPIYTLTDKCVPQSLLLNEDFKMFTD